MTSERPSFRGWRLPATAAILLVLGLLEASPWPRPILQRMSDILQLALSGACGLLCLRAGFRGSPQAKAFWRLLAADMLLWAAGQAVWAWQMLSLTPARLPDLSDFLFLASTAPVVLAALVRPDRPRESGPSHVFDALLVAVLALHIYAYTSLNYFLAGDSAAYLRLLNWLGHGCDALAVAAFLWLIATASPPWRGLYIEIAQPLLLFHVGEAVVNPAITAGLYHPGFFDVPWTVPFVWLGLTALDWNPGKEFDAGTAPPQWRDTRRGALLAIGVVVFVPAMHLLQAPWIGTNLDLARLRSLLTLATTTLVGGLFLLRQTHLLAALEESEKIREQTVRRLDERFSLAFTASPVAMVIARLEHGLILDVNARAASLAKLPRERLLGRTAAELGIWADDSDRVATRNRLKAQGALHNWPSRFKNAAGEIREVVGSYDIIEIGEDRCVLAVFEDVTEHKKMEAQNRQIHGMEAVGRLAGGIAHDFNNLLMTILGYSSALLQKLDPASPHRRHVTEIQRAGERAAALTRQLLAFGRKQVLAPEVLDLAAVIAGSVEMLKRLVGDDVEIVGTFDEELGRVKADRGQLEQVLANLAVNARDAMPTGGQLRIGARNEEILEASPAVPGLRAGAYCVLTVQDTGVGMTPEVVARAFEPFFTTKGGARGSGMGLATVYGIVKQSGGYVALESRPGKGATFRVYLPRVSETGPVPALAHAAGKGIAGGETILLVEDNPSVRDVTQAMLEDSGYSVLPAAGGEEALQMTRDHPGSIDLLLTDVVMPGMKGPEVAERVLVLRPGIKVLFASGYAEDRLGSLGQGRGFIQKPYRIDALVNSLRALLDA